METKLAVDEEMKDFIKEMHRTDAKLKPEQESKAIFGESSNEQKNEFAESL